MKKDGGGCFTVLGIGGLAFLAYVRLSESKGGVEFKFNEIGYTILAISFIMIVIGLIKIAFGGDDPRR